MKKTVILLIFISAVIFGQENISQDKYTSAIDNLFSLSQQKDYKTACNFIAYTGNEESRKYNDKLNASQASELKISERLLKKLKAYLDISDSYSINGNITESRSDKEFSIVQVDFSSGNQKLEVKFEFVKVNDKLLLSAIE